MALSGAMSLCGHRGDTASSMDIHVPRVCQDESINKELKLRFDGVSPHAAYGMPSVSECVYY